MAYVGDGGGNTQSYLRADGSYALPPVFTGGVSNIGNTSGDTGSVSNRLILAGGNNVTLSQSTNAGGATVTISAGAGGGGGGFQSAGLSNVGNTAGDTGLVSNQLVLAGGNNITLSGSTNGGSATVTVSAPTQTNQTLGGYFVGNTTGQSSSSTYDARTLSFNGDGIVSAGWSNGSVMISATQSNQAFSAQGGSSAFQTLSFANANGLTFSNNGGSVQASYTVPTVTNSSMTVSDAATSGTLARLAFTNQNGVTLSLSTGAGGSHTIVGSHNGLTSQSNQNVTAANGGFAFQTLSFSNLNGVSFGTSAGSAITASHNGITSQTNQTVGGYFVGNTTGQSSSSTVDARSISFDGAGIVSAGWSAGSIRISATQSNQALSAEGGSSAFQTMSFSNNAHLSFTNSNGQVAAQPIRGSIFAVSNTTQSSSMTANLSALSFHGAGIASVGASNGSVMISVPAGGGGGDGYNIIAVNGVATSLSTTMTLSNSNNVSFGINAGVITASAAAGGGATLSKWMRKQQISNAAVQFSSNSASIFPLIIQENVALSGMVMAASISGATAANNSSASKQLSYSAVLYSRNVSTLSSIISASFSTGVFHTSNGTASFNGGRKISMSFNNTTVLTPGEYWMGVWARTSNSGTGGATTALAMSQSMAIGIPQASGMLSANVFNSAGNASQPLVLGLGLVSFTNTSASIAFSALTGTGGSPLAADLWLELRNYSIY